MNFSEFLKQRRTQNNLVSAKEHYEELGGEKVLKISLRHFQQIEGGKYPPSEDLLAALFEKTRPSERKTLVTAYFRSVLSGTSGGTQLIEYLDYHLSPEIEKESKSLWESGRRLMMYSEEQLNFLADNVDALRFHRRLLLLGNCSKNECTLDRGKLKALEKLNLIEVQKDEIRPSRSLYRIPNYENSNPRAVASASDFILKQVDAYISREGSPNQELSYAMQMVTPAVADRILEQMKAFKKWVQSLASTDEGPSMTPLVFVGFAKKMERKEL